MILYNVTVNVEADVHDEWLKWMREVHVPQVLATNKFVDNKICRILNRPEEGHTYSFQYFCRTMADYEAYRDTDAPALQADVAARYANKFVAFRTLMEILD